MSNFSILYFLKERKDGVTTDHVAVGQGSDDVGGGGGRRRQIGQTDLQVHSPYD